MDTNSQAQSLEPHTNLARISQPETSPTPDEMISPEAVAWAAAITEEWHKIYSRFKEDVEAMIQRGGGQRRVDVQSYLGSSFRGLGLHLDFQADERQPEVQKAAPSNRAKF
jgi:hypothetical protein